MMKSRARMFLPYILVALLIVVLLFIFRTEQVTAPVTYKEPATPELVTSNATDFSEKGYAKAEEGIQNLSFVYEKPGKPALTKKLSFDALSFCASMTGATSCMAMSVSFDMAYGGKRVMIEGEDKGDAVLVRKLTAYEEDREFFALPTSGNVFISWPKAQELIINCEVDMVMQAHSLNVDLTMKNGTRYRSVEPQIDEVFTVVQKASETCGNIGIATE